MLGQANLTEAGPVDKFGSSSPPKLEGIACALAQPIIRRVPRTNPPAVTDELPVVFARFDSPLYLRRAERPQIG